MTLEIGWPQGIFLAWAAFSVVLHISKHGDKADYHGPAKFVAMALLTALLYWGGFFGGLR